MVRKSLSEFFAKIFADRETLFEILPKVAFYVSGAFLLFLAGFAAYHFKLPPYEIWQEAFKQQETLLEQANLKTPHHVFRSVYDRTGVKIMDREKVAAGVTLITTYWPEFNWTAGVKIINIDGETLHSWPIDVRALFPNLGEYGDYVHGAHLFKNGNLLINIEFNGLALLNSCGKTLWKLEDPVTHHSVFYGESGNYWVSANRRQKGEQGQIYLKNYPGFRAPVFEDFLLEVSSSGEAIREISLLEVLYKNGLQRYIAKNSRRVTGDILHLNDIEELSTDLAEDFPQFDAGNLVVSLRYPHLVFVMDPDTLEVKWWVSDKINEQHDPDFLEGGWIGIFDNNKDKTFRGVIGGGSRIIAFRPSTGEAKVLYPSEISDPFYTQAGGKWQRLPNGNLLMVEARAGRAFEADADGRTVWEWIHTKYDKNGISEVLEATRYDFDEDTIRGWSCGSE